MKNLIKGFTLTELLITIAIIGILAAIAMPRYFQTESARVSEAVSQLSLIRLAEENYKNDRGCYCGTGNGACTPALADCWDELGVDNPATLPNAFFTYELPVVNGAGTGFCVVAQRNSNGNPPAEFTDTTVCIDERGAYFGSHPNGPGAGPATDGGCLNIC